jgi:hypothetical protein
MSGINLTYNFDNFLPQKRRVDPFVVSGFEYFEFLSKSDLYDAFGNRYHYWSDGSIMSVDENAPNASDAIPLIRDYNYETDIRKTNEKLFGKYPERSFAIPVGAGVSMHLTPRVNFKLGATMHFTFTDYIDGINAQNKGQGRGDSKKDKFLETYFTLSFALFNPRKEMYISPLSDAELLALENEDSDGDGVSDFKDVCQGTPQGIAVNAYGCPVDSDGDGKPDYADKEPNSPIGALVDENGVAMDDSTIAHNWQVWSDSTGEYIAYNLAVNPPAVTPSEYYDEIRESTIVYRRELVVLLGKYKEGIPTSEMDKLLNVPDIRSSLQPDSTTVYITGSYNTSAEAEKRKNELVAAGFPNAIVMVRNKDGTLSELTDNLLAEFKGKETKDRIPLHSPKGEGNVVYRIQLGAYSKKLSTSIFKDIGQMVVMKTEDGLYKYVTGGFYSIQDALKERDVLTNKGYKGAFVVAYKGGKRVSLSSVSGGIIQQKEENIEEPKKEVSAVDKKLIFFRVQVGAFVNEPPAEVLQKLSKIPGLEKKKKSTGVTQYLAGKFNDYEEAKRFRDEVVEKYGIKDAFLIAFFKDEMISVQEAVELLK